MPNVRMNPVTADAMQCRALGSRLFERNPAFISFTAAYPSQMVHWPDPNMPTAVGPFSFSTRFHCAAITSNALSHVIGVNSPFLSYLPSVMRRSGVVSRSLPYMIFDRKYPFTQLIPRFTSLFWSPCVATTRPSLTATITPQPTPQKRHGAFDHLSCAASASMTTFWAPAGSATPATAAAALAADRRMKSLREMLIRWLLARARARRARPRHVGRRASPQGRR